MEAIFLAAVLVAAISESLLHALIKGIRDSYAMSLVVAMFGGVAALPVLAMTGMPDPAAWGWLAASVSVGVLYWLALGWAYQTGELIVVFPLSRGSAVLLSALGAAIFMGETLSLPQAATVSVVLFGLALVALAGTGGKFALSALWPTIALATITTCFTLIDANGVRAAGSALSYTAVLYIGNALGIGAFALMTLRPRIAALGHGVLLPGMGAAILSLGGYALILFAMRHVPVGLVAALTETSIIFVALLARFWLRETLRASQLAGMACVGLGLAVLRLTP